MSPFPVKDWKDSPDASTPISAAALEDLEARLAAYTDSAVSAVSPPTQVNGVFGLPSVAARNNFLPTTFDHDNFGGAAVGATQATYRYRHLVVKDAREIRVLYCNYDGNAGGPGIITVRLGIELATGEVIPAFYDGKRSVDVEPGGYCLSDPVPIDQTAGTLIYSRLNISVAAAQLPAPSGLTVSAVASGGSFAANTYFWKITATNAYGQTTGSNEVTSAVVLNGSAVLTWPAVPSATGYKVYRSTVSGTYTTPALVATLGQVTTYTDTGTAVGAGALPGSNTAAMKWKIPNAFLSLNTDYGVDRTTGGAFVGGAQYGTFPAAIFGTAASSQQIVGLGDSILFGQGEGEPTAGLGGGFLARALGSTIPYLNMGFPGEYAVDISGDGAKRARRWAFIGSASKVVVAYGVNDWHFGSASAATIEARILAIATMLNRRGLPCFVCTITPVTSSTDSWATTVNQTPFTGSTTVRAAFNQWARAGCPIDPTTKAAVAVGTSGALLAGQAGHPITNVFDTGSTVETSTDSGIWALTYTGDGVHPTGPGHIAMAAAINTSLLG